MVLLYGSANRFNPSCYIEAEYLLSPVLNFRLSELLPFCVVMSLLAGHPLDEPFQN